MNLAPITLHGHLVRLEPLGSRHLDGLCAVGLDESLWTLTQNVIRSPADMQGYLEEALGEMQAGTQLPFATVEQASGVVVGSTRFGSVSHEHRRVEIGWTWIGARWQRSGVNTEAKYLMLSHAFETMSARRVELKTNALNTRSRDAMRRIGATEEGTLRQHMIRPDGSSRDSVYFSIIDGEWPAVKARLQGMMASGARTVGPARESV